MTGILRELGLNSDGQALQGGKKLLDRKVVARFIDQVKADGGAPQLDGARGSGPIKDSSFTTVNALSGSVPQQTIRRLRTVCTFPTQPSMGK